MTYKILSKRQSNDTIITLVEYVIEGQTLELEVSHFRPESLAVIEDGIKNRAKSERATILAIPAAESLLPEVPVGETVTIEE